MVGYGAQRCGIASATLPAPNPPYDIDFVIGNPKIGFVLRELASFGETGSSLASFVRHVGAPIKQRAAQPRFRVHARQVWRREDDARQLFDAATGFETQW